MCRSIETVSSEVQFQWLEYKRNACFCNLMRYFVVSFHTQTKENINKFHFSMCVRFFSSKILWLLNEEKIHGERKKVKTFSTILSPGFFSFSPIDSSFEDFFDFHPHSTQCYSHEPFHQ